jgi:pyruvate dehydrogenase E2 component (dihydrolipoamide acetyltransferase)
VLAVGAVRQAPAVWENQVVPRWQMQAVLSVDHRIVDGAVAAKFMDDFKRRLEKPVGLALEAPQEAE